MKMKIRTVYHRLLSIVVLCTCFVTLPAAAQTKPWVTTYYGGWEQGTADNGYLPSKDVDFSAMTVVDHMALSLTSTGTLDSLGNGITAINSANLISAAHKAGTKVEITIGGWYTESRFLSSTSPTYFNAFVNNIVNFVKERGYDGVDIDWEPLTAADTTQFKELVTALRAALPSPQYLLTSTSAYGEPYSMFAGIQNELDQINLMTYDLSGAWQGWVTWYNSALYQNGVTFPSTGGPVPSADNLVQYFVQAGVNPSKLSIGAELGGTVWQGGVTGPDQSWSVAPSVTADVPLYSFDGTSGIMRQYYSPSRYHWDAGAQVPYLSIDTTVSADDCFISYDDSASIAAKFAYAHKEHLGGIMIYELGMGYPGNGTFPILEGIKRDMLAYSSGTPQTVVPPTIAISSPSNGDSVSGSITISANVTDSSAIDQVVFQIDGKEIGSPCLVAPYSTTLNTSSLTNGSHTISATVTDDAGEEASASVFVVVNNQETIVQNSAPSGQGLWVYKDSLSTPWMSTSWGATVDFSVPSPTQTGDSTIEVTQGAWGGLGLHYGGWYSGYLNPGSFLGIEFQIYSTVNLSMAVELESDSAGVKFNQVPCGNVPANQWTVISLPMSELDSSQNSFSGVDIMEMSGASKLYYVRDVWFFGLSAPVPLSPLDGTENVATRTQLVWQKSAFATSYRVQVATDTVFSKCMLDSCGAASDSLLLSALVPGSTYYWRVSALSSAQASGWSPIWKFTAVDSTITVIYQDSLVSPWMNTSWSATVNLNDTTSLMPGYTHSIGVAQDKWGALSVHYGGWNGAELDPSVYIGIRFQVYSESQLSLSVELGNDLGTSFSPVAFGTVPAKKWTSVSVPTSQLDPSNVGFNRIDILETSGNAVTYYVENLALEGNSNIGGKIATGVQNDNPQVPTTLTLQQNYPNPFNPTTTISFNLPKESRASLVIYDLLGQQIAVLVDGELAPGAHTAVWNAENYASGVYFYRLQTSSGSVTKKMILMK